MLTKVELCDFSYENAIGSTILCTSDLLLAQALKHTMEPKAKQTGLFLLTGLVLAVAAIYSLPIQQAEACGKHCGDNGGGNYKKEDCGCGGSLISVDDNNVGNNIGNINTGHILSGNKIKALNDVNVLSKNHLNDVNVLSKNNNYLNDVNVLSKNLDKVELDKVLFSNDVIDGDGLNGNSVLVAFDKLLGH